MVPKILGMSGHNNICVAISKENFSIAFGKALQRETKRWKILTDGAP